MTITFHDLLNYSGFIVAITGAIVIGSKWRQNSVYLNLAGFVLTYGSGAIVPVLFRGGIYAKYPFLIYFPLEYSIFALAFLYVFLTRLSGIFNIKRTRLIFLIPILVTISHFYFWCFPPIEKVNQLEDGAWMRVYVGYEMITVIFSSVMIFVCLWIVGRYQKEVDQFYSDGLPTGFIWVKTICYYLLLMILVSLVPQSAYPVNLFPYIKTFFTVSNIALLIWITTEGINQIYQYIPSIQDDLESEEYESTSKDESLFARLTIEIEEKEYYRLGNLNLNDLADALNFSPRKLSNLINQQTGKNFRNFINSFRVNHAKAQLKAGALETMNMNGLAQESGFKSRTTFYSAFKQEVGTTPLDYLKENENKEGVE